MVRPHLRKKTIVYKSLPRQFLKCDIKASTKCATEKETKSQGHTYYMFQLHEFLSDEQGKDAANFKLASASDAATLRAVPF